jgi:hypothetical protein
MASVHFHQICRLVYTLSSTSVENYDRPYPYHLQHLSTILRIIPPISTLFPPLHNFHHSSLSPFLKFRKISQSLFKIPSHIQLFWGEFCQGNCHVEWRRNSNATNRFNSDQHTFSSSQLHISTIYIVITLISIYINIKYTKSSVNTTM